ncbi:MAG: branched-chain amino acid transport system ATP-binding protein [Actinomycetota bacterium]|nr:branched-chain amino acid transport system ATP-binding protein [Actinomycetota bacterium]
MSRLEVSNVRGGYTEAPVLRDVAFTLDASEIVGLLGANGAGKTTLLRALSGTLPTCDGTVLLDGEPLQRLSPWARVAAGLVHVPEGRHVFGAMTVRENLDVAGLVRRGAVPKDDVYELFPRLAERQSQQAGSLSGGEQQMLAIGRALMTKPRVLLIDEMSAGLAPVLVHQLVDGLMRLRGRDTAVFLVEQSPHFIADAVDRVYLLERGAIVGGGRLDDLGGADGLAQRYLGVS